MSRHAPGMPRSPETFCLKAPPLPPSRIIPRVKMAEGNSISYVRDMMSSTLWPVV